MIEVRPRYYGRGKKGDVVVNNSALVYHYIGLILHALGATTDEYGNVLTDLFWSVGMNETID